MSESKVLRNYLREINDKRKTFGLPDVNYPKTTKQCDRLIDSVTADIDPARIALVANKNKQLMRARKQFLDDVLASVQHIKLFLKLDSRDQ